MQDLNRRLDEVFSPTINCHKLFESRDTLIQTLDAAAKTVGVPVMVIGGAALPKYGYDRTTKDIDIVTTVDGAHKMGDLLQGREDFKFIGHSKFKHSSGRDVNFCPEGVVVGHSKFPKPESDVPGLSYVSLPHLLAMKVQAKRLKDRGDYAELVKRNDLSLEYIKNDVFPYLHEMDKKWAVRLWEQARKEM
jgi:hypothetical protein